MGSAPRCLPTARGAEREGKAPELRAAGPPHPLPGPGGVTSVWKATEARSGDGCAAALHTRTPSPTLTAPRGQGCEAAERGRRGADTWPPPTAASVPRAPVPPALLQTARHPAERGAPPAAPTHMPVWGHPGPAWRGRVGRQPSHWGHAHARAWLRPRAPHPFAEGPTRPSALGSRSRPWGQALSLY